MITFSLLFFIVLETLAVLFAFRALSASRTPQGAVAWVVFLISAPYFKNDTTINVVGDLTSKAYADITLDIMRDFGITVENESYNRFFIKAAQTYCATNYTIESDWSSASYFLAAAAITQGEVTLTGLNPNSIQGDAGFLNVLERMGCIIERSTEKIFIKGNP